MTETRSDIELSVGAALNVAEDAAWTTDQLVALALSTAITGIEAATAMHHAYNAEYHVRRAFELSEGVGSWSEMPSQQVGDCLNWMQKGREHADQLCRCFPGFDESSGRRVRFIAEWAKSWPQVYEEATTRAQDMLDQIDKAIRTISRQLQIAELGKT